MKTTSSNHAIAIAGVMLLVVAAFLFASAVLATSTQPRSVSYAAAGVSAAAAVICFTRRKK